MLAVMTIYHTPVMLAESLEALDITPEGIFVDLTFGGGGHSSAILEKLGSGQLIAFDQDKDAEDNAVQIDNTRFTFINANFRHCKRYLKMEGIDQVDGVIADLGISSHQINTPERGFSTRFESELDMRMDKSVSKNAKIVINEYPEHELHKIFGLYGEIKNARTLARKIVSSRVNRSIEGAGQLLEILRPLAPKGRQNKYFAQVFQALRIEVNDELKALEEMLIQMTDIIKTNGRLVVISYHSLEDRLVKNFLQSGNFRGQPIKDFYGNLQRPFKPFDRKPITPNQQEVELNPRSRSAKLRIGIKL